MPRVRFLFRTPFRDVSTGLRLARRSVLEDIELAPNIVATVADMWRIYHRIFSDAYDLPSGARVPSQAPSRGRQKRGRLNAGAAAATRELATMMRIGQTLAHGRSTP
jgi:hypothetical protein